MYWPSFNAALVAPDYVAQHRSVINTYFSLAAACVTTFALSPVFQRSAGKWRLSMVSDHLLNYPYNINVLSTRPVSRIAKTINQGMLSQMICHQILKSIFKRNHDIKKLGELTFRTWK